MTRRLPSTAATAAWLLWLPACGATATTAPAADHLAAPAQAPVATELVGRWARYWSTSGRVDTECYVFDQDGRFHWRKADNADVDVSHRSGTWAKRGHELALAVDQQRIRAGQATPTQQHLALPLGPCPDNPEARAMDARYACISIDGKAFFRQRK